MTTMGLSQVESAPAYVAGHTLDLVFSARQDGDDLGVEELSVVPLTDHYLMRFRLLKTLSLFRDGVQLTWSTQGD